LGDEKVKDIGSLDLSGSFNGSLLNMILDAGLMVKFVLLTLYFFRGFVGDHLPEISLLSKD